MSKFPIYTIGYGGRSIAEFVSLLQRYEIAFLVDVRSQPYSRHDKDFSKAELQVHLAKHDIRYMFMGDLLGGRPRDASCYVDGRVDYTRVREKPFFQYGIQRLQTAWEKQYHVALMCAEAKPQECHRSKLIGNSLVERYIDVMHIDEYGERKEQENVNQIVICGQPSLFGASEDKLNHSQKTYSVSRKKQ